MTCLLAVLTPAVLAPLGGPVLVLVLLPARAGGVPPLVDARGAGRGARTAGAAGAATLPLRLRTVQHGGEVDRRAAVAAGVPARAGLTVGAPLGTCLLAGGPLRTGRPAVGGGRGVLLGTPGLARGLAPRAVGGADVAATPALPDGGDEVGLAHLGVHGDAHARGELLQLGQAEGAERTGPGRGSLTDVGHVLSFPLGPGSAGHGVLGCGPAHGRRRTGTCHGREPGSSVGRS